MPGLIGAADALAEAYLAAGMYTDAINAFRLRLMLLNLSAPEVAKTSPKYISAVSYCTYNLCSAIFLSGDLSTAMVEIKDYFASFPTFTAIGGRMMSLLMCCNFQLGRVDTAVQLYDMAATVYAFAVGANHSIHAVHMCTLGDLYREQSLVAKGGRSLSRVMMTMATETSKSFLGEGHRLSVAYSVKLAILCLEEGAYTDAGNLLNTAIGFYESYPVQNRFVAREIVRGAYLLAAAYARMNDTFEAIHWAEISTVKAEMAYTNDTPLYVIDTLVLLSDLYVKMKNLPKSVAAVRKAIEVVRCGVENHADIGHLLARLVCKLLRVNAMAQRLQPRELMHILAGEEKSMYPAAFQLGIPGPEFRINYPAEFEKGCSLVFSALWDLPGDEFFNTLMSQINAQEVSEEVFEQKVSSESKANNFVGTSTDLLAVSRGVQGSVLMDLIENTKMDW
jgi:tetratricopeptide (TPR) repeat protein